MDPLEPVLSKLLIVIVIISILINMAAYKKRWLADSLYHLECATRLVAIMIPNAAGYYFRNGILHLMVFGGVTVMLFTGSGFEVIFSSLAVLFHFIVGASVNYGEPELSSINIAKSVVLSLMFFLM